MKNLLSTDDSLLLVIDVQERLVPAMEQGEKLVKNVRLLLEGANLLQVPVFVSEQYPQGLGATIPAVAGLLPAERQYCSKKSFSCCDESGFLERIVAAKNRPNIVVCGMETHVCVMQTALDLLALGKNVAIVVDAVGSRFRSDHKIGLRRMERADAVLCSTEMILFEWCKTAENPVFKELSRLVKSR